MKLSWRSNPATREKDRSDKPAYVRRYRVTAEEGAQTAIAQMRTLLSVDDQMEAIRRRLAATGELDDTLVVFLSDNGKIPRRTRPAHEIRPLPARSTYRCCSGGPATCPPDATPGSRR